MVICCPKDGFVVKLYMESGREVKLGEPLLQIDSEQEDRLAERVRVREELRKLNFAQYTGPQIALVRSVAKTALATAEAQYKNAELVHDQDIKRIEVGTLPGPDRFKVEAAFAQAVFNRDRARADRMQLEYAISKHQKSHDLAKSINEYYANQIKTRISRLVLTAPVAGKVIFNVAPGSFAELGGHLAEVS